MRRLLILILTITVISGNSVALALPEMLDSFNVKYNTKGTRLDTCDLCHLRGEPQRSSCDEVCHTANKPEKVDPINLNPYGKSFNARSGLPTNQALKSIENIDSAGDGVPNINKIKNLTFPGDKENNSTDKPKDSTKNKNLFSMFLDVLNRLI